MSLLDLTPDQWTAIGLLGNGIAQKNFTGGAVNAMGYLDQAPDRKLKQQYTQMQVNNLQSEIDQRKLAALQDQRKQSILEELFPKGAPGMPSQPSMPGQLGSGSFGAVEPPAGMPAIPPVMSPQQNFGARLTPETLARLKLGAGVDLTDIAKLTQPDWHVDGGYRWNARDPSTSTGFIPQAKVSENGQATLLTPGKDGLPVVSAPQGALDTYSSYRNADEAAKAGRDLVKVVGPDGAERYVTRAQAVQAAQPRPMPRQPMPQPQEQTPAGQPQGNFVGEGQVVLAAINDIKDPNERQRARAAYEQQYGPLQATPTTAQVTHAAADKEQAVQTVKDVAEQRKGIVNAGFVAPGNIAKYQQIGKLLADVDGGKYTPAGTEFASALNSFGIKVDKNLPNKEAAASLANQAALELRNPAGGAGMPGAMSDSDRNFLAGMTPNMAQSAQGRKMVIDTYIAVQTRNQQVAQFARNYEKKYGKLDNGFFDQLQSWSSTNPLFKGQ